jgi:DNA mismatch repair protein MutS2
LQIELEEQREKTSSLLEKETLLKRRLQKADEDQQRIEQEKRNLQAEMKLERTRILEQAQQEAQQAIAALSNPNLKLHEAIAIKRMLEHQDLEEELIVSSDQGELSVGDYAAYEALGVSGKITSISKKQTTLLTNDGKTIKVTTANLVKIEPPADNEKKVAFINKNEIRVSQELNIIGQRVDEALDSLDAYLDSALAANLKRVRIIHGLGTGALRRMVTNYLDSKSFVASYRYGEAGEGGAGATVVFLK